MSQMEYDPLGKRLKVVGEDGHVVLGYRGGLHDPWTDLVMFEAGAKVYDPTTGRHVTPDYSGFLDHYQLLPWRPEEMASLYQANFHDSHPLLSTFTDFSSLTG